jgi:hypothetical protein
MRILKILYPELRREFIEAYKDYKYLLNRGYSRKLSLDVVTARYNLNIKERNLLYRCVHSDEELKIINSKKIKFEEVKNLIIDGFNMGLTILSIINKDEVFLCDDGFIRDMNLGKRKNEPAVFDVLLLLSEFLNNIGINFLIILDYQISKSGELSKKLKERKINVILSKTADKFVIFSNSPVASNDYIILFKAKNIVEIIGKILENENIIIYSGPWSKNSLEHFS